MQVQLPHQGQPALKKRLSAEQRQDTVQQVLLNRGDAEKGQADLPLSCFCHCQHVCGGLQGDLETPNIFSQQLTRT